MDQSSSLEFPRTIAAFYSQSRPIVVSLGALNLQRLRLILRCCSAQHVLLASVLSRLAFSRLVFNRPNVGRRWDHTLPIRIFSRTHPKIRFGFRYYNKIGWLFDTRCRNSKSAFLWHLLLYLNRRQRLSLNNRRYLLDHGYLRLL